MEGGGWERREEKEREREKGRERERFWRRRGEAGRETAKKGRAAKEESE